MLVGGIAAAVLAVSLVSVFTVDANTVGVEVLFGKPTNSWREGLHFKNPLSKIVHISGVQQESTYSARVSEGEKGGFDAVSAVTADNAVVEVDATLLWNLDLNLAEEIYRQYRDLETVRSRLVRPTSRNVIRDCMALYAFEEARTTGRAAIALCAEEGIQSETEQGGVLVSAVQIRGMTAQSAELQASIDRKLSAEQAAREAEFRRDQARVDAETARIKATGEAEATIERARGQAEGNRLLDASLTPPILTLRSLQAIADGGGVFFWTGDTSGAQPVLDISDLVGEIGTTK